MSTGVLVAVGDVDFESQVLAASVAGGLHVVRRCVDVADLLATAATRQAAVALVSVDLRGLDTEVLARLRDEQVAVIGVASGDLSAAAHDLRRLGVRFLVSVAELHQLPAKVADALESGLPGYHGPGNAAPDPDIVGPAPLEAPARRAGQVVAVWGPTGAPGRSVVALGLAALLAESGLSTMLVDADVYGGSQAQLLGLLDESSGLLAAARSANREVWTPTSWPPMLGPSRPRFGCSPGCLAPTGGSS